GLDVQITHGRERPGDANRPRLRCRHRGGGIRRVTIAEKAKRPGRRKLGETVHLLTGAALELGTEQPRTARALLEAVRERGNRVARAAEQNESADSGGEGGVDGGAIGSK